MRENSTKNHPRLEKDEWNYTKRGRREKGRDEGGGGRVAS